MKYILKIVLFFCLLWMYSCSSNTKKTKIDKDSVTLQKDKVITQNSSKGIDRDTLKQPVITDLVFPNFKLRLNNFIFYGDWDDNGKFMYYGDTSTMKFDASKYNIWTLTSQNDTIGITYFNGGYYSDKVEIIPKNKDDRFEISYSFKITIANKKEGAVWENMMPYHKIEDSLNYFFRIPKNAFDKSDTYITAIKKKLNLRDTTYKFNGGEDGEQIVYDVIYQNKLCSIGDNAGTIYLKIDRYNENKIVEKKFLIIYSQGPD